MTINIEELWNYSNPEDSEARFRTAMPNASNDDKLILITQIARTFTLRRNFEQALSILASIKSIISNASPEAQVRYFLELGRSYASPTHSEKDRTLENDNISRAHYLQAFQIAKSACLDSLAIDALHMMPVVDTDPAIQLQWNEKAIDYMENSSQADSRLWEASLRNNVGYARHLMGDYDEALRQFELSLKAHKKAGNTRAIRIANWMIAWTYRAQNKFMPAIEI